MEKYSFFISFKITSPSATASNSYSAKKDLGFYFPSNESTPKNISSVEMLNKVLEIIEYDKVVINNIDITVLSQVINISKISEAIISNLADLLRIDKQLINVKGKSFI